MTKNWSRFPLAEPIGEDLANFSAYRLYERSAIAGYGVLSGCVVTRTSVNEVAAASGVFTVSGVSKTFAGANITSIAATAATKHRYDLIYIDGADLTLKTELGVEEVPDSALDFLENYHPRPAEPTDTDWIILAIVRVTDAGITDTEFGSVVYAQDSIADMRLGPALAVDDVTLQVISGVASVKSMAGHASTHVSGGGDSIKLDDLASPENNTDLNVSAVAHGLCPIFPNNATTWLRGDGTYTAVTASSLLLGANCDVGSYKITALQFESDIATGVGAPFVVASTAKVTNLNSDTLDGLHDTSFIKAAGTVGLAADWDVGSYKITALQFESDIATGVGAPFVVASTAKVTNLNADSVDGNNMDTVTTKGDLLIGSGAGDLDRLGVGANGLIPIAASGETVGIKWAVAYAYAPAHYERSRMWKNKGSDSAANRRTLVTPDFLTVNVNNVGYALLAALELDLDADTGVWDTLVGTDYSTAANRAGKDFYVYACTPVSGSVPVILVSAATTFPSGYAANTSRKIGGFHCECYAVGTIAGHALTGYLAGDILPRSVWDLQHRSAGPQVGMVWAGKTDFDSAFYGATIWVAIYLASGTGASTTSVNGGTISDTRNWMDFVDDFAAIGCRMLEDDEFQAIAAGSNEECNIATGADPATTGGHTAYELLTLDVAPGGGGWAAGDYIIGATSTFSCKIVQVLSTTTYIVKNRTGAFTLGEVLNNSELLTLDVAPANPYWSVGNTITGASSGKSCVILEVLTNLTYAVKLRNGNFTAGEILSNGTTTADQGGAHPTVTTTIAADQGETRPIVALDYTYGGRMISYIGCEDCCGAMWQWLRTQSFRSDDVTGWGGYDLPGAKGSLYNQDGAGGVADIKLLAGGVWGDGAACGSRCRGAHNYRWAAASVIGGRFCAEPS